MNSRTHLTGLNSLRTAVSSTLPLALAALCILTLPLGALPQSAQAQTLRYRIDRSFNPLGIPFPLQTDRNARSAPALGDLDDDGDLDLALARTGGTIYFENIGTVGAPLFVERDGGSNSFNALDMGEISAPTLADLDGAGDLDMVAGETQGSLSYFENTGTSAAPIFTQVIDSANPFSGLSVPNRSAPTLADLDSDGDLDAIVGIGDGTLSYLENIGTTTVPDFVRRSGVDNVFDGVDVGFTSAPTFADLDGDGDLDLVAGEDKAPLNYFENTGTAFAPAFTQRTGAANPLGSLDVGNQRSRPVLADLDGDGNIDVVVGGEEYGALVYLENTGTRLAPAFTRSTGDADPFSGSVDIGAYSAPAFADLDGDGDFDMVAGESDGILLYFENTGTKTSPGLTERTGAGNPLSGVDVGAYSAPAFADLDGDGDFDMVVGEGGGALFYFENTGTKATARVHRAHRSR